MTPKPWLNKSADTQVETQAQRYWRASLAWKNIGDFAVGWSQGAFIDELRQLCLNQGKVGLLADELLDDVVKDIERKHLHDNSNVFPIRATLNPTEPNSLVIKA